MPQFTDFASSVTEGGIIITGNVNDDSGSPHASQQPRWPSIEEQLAASRVPRGSALEHLIRDNQHFEMLEDEPADLFGLPPWLRAYWRKLHPEAGVCRAERRIPAFARRSP